MSSFLLRGNLVDVLNERIYPAEISISEGKINSVSDQIDLKQSMVDMPYIMPGFIDAHVHIESSMLIPSEFARLAVVHGTVATVSDPHEIANVCGVKGVMFMIENGKKVPFKFHFGAPSCVPATTFETAGAVLDAHAVQKLLENGDIYYLSEMMNFPGVLNEDPEVMKKISAAHHLLKPVDGHAPGLRGEDAKKYIAAGITTDHECFTKEEALDKLQNGMKILIREGSAARNFDALIGLLQDFSTQMMFCSDDKHPDSLVAGHIDQLCSRAVAKGIDLFKVLRAACVNPVLHYGMKVGLLRAGDPADFVLVKDLRDFQVLETYIDGRKVASRGKSLVESVESDPVNNFSCNPVSPDDIRFQLQDDRDQIWIIEPIDGQLITNKHSQLTMPLANSKINSILEGRPDLDVLKIVVVNRYAPAKPAVAFIKNFGLKSGAISSSVAHDSHNIVAVGANDESICNAVNKVIGEKGGISFVNGAFEMILPLPVAGLMSAEDGYKVAKEYSQIDKAVKDAGCSLSAPFMTLSFMALLVIPHLKLGDLGLFDGDKFQLVE